MKELIGKEIIISHPITITGHVDYLAIRGTVLSVEGDTISGYMGRNKDRSIIFNISFEQIKEFNKDLIRELKLNDIGL